MNVQLVKAPVYQQLNELLKQLARSGELKSGAQFLTERQVAERFDVSRATANKALSNLVSEGILEFRKGVGTFVKPNALALDIRTLVSFTERAHALGNVPRTRVLSFRASNKKPKSEGAAALALGVGEAVFEMDRLRFVDERPAILEHRVVRARLCPSLDSKRAAGSLYGVWTQDFGLTIAGAEQTLRAALASRAAAGLLGIEPGAACLEITAVGRVRDGTALWWERTLYRGDCCEFSNQLGGMEHSAGARLQLVKG